MKRSTIRWAAVTTALAASAAFYNATKPEPDFWQKNNFQPLETSEGLAHRGELVQRFANNSVTGYATPQDKCAAHSLALQEEKMNKADKKADIEESFFITTYIMFKCQRGEKPHI